MVFKRIAATLALLGLCVADGAQAVDLEYSYYGDFGDTGRGRNELAAPVAMDKSEKDILAVVDRDRNTVVLYDKKGNWLKSLGRPKGEGAVEFKAPSGVVFDDIGRIWVADTGNNRVVAVNQNGLVLKSIGGYGIRKGEFSDPVAVAFGGRDLLFIADSGNKRIQLIKTTGEFVDQWVDKTSRGAGPVRAPRVLAYSSDGDGHLWLANQGSPKLQKLDMEGRSVLELDLSLLVEGDVRVASLHADPAFDRLFVCDSAANRVLVVSGGRLIGRVDLPPGSRATASAVSWNQSIFIADKANGRILEYRR